MKNRAKCKLCGDILESFHRHDFVSCKCGEISIDGGGDYYKCAARDFNNFLRVDDEGNEIIPTVIDDIKELTNIVKKEEEKKEITKKDVVDSIDHLINAIDGLPTHAKATYINQYDMLSILTIMKSMMKF